MSVAEKIKASLNAELERNHFAIKWSGILGFISHPIYYLVWTYILPQPYDNLTLRLSAAFFCIPLIFHKHFPKKWSIGIPIHWYFSLCFALPFTCTFLTIKNDFSTMWMMTEVMMIFIMALCIEHSLLLMLTVLAGILASTIAAIATTANPIVLTATVQANLTLLPVVLICSMACSQAIKKGRLLLEINKAKLHESNLVSETLAEKNDALKQQASSIAHEMRNPLAQVKGCLNILKNILPAPVSLDQNATLTIPLASLTKGYDYIEKGQGAIESGLAVIDNLLANARGEKADPSTFIYLQAGLITKKAIDTHAYAEGERTKVNVRVIKDFDFKGQESMTLYVLKNLLKNALYYFKEKPTATLTITVDSHCIRVRDTGVGIAPSRIAGLFEPFKTQGKVGGTGLGLSFCKEQMQAMGGTIACESKLGEYTEFILNFPAIDAAELAQYQQSVISDARACFTGKRFLVVDDIEEIRLATILNLQGLGVEIDEAANGQEAVDAICKTHYDLVLMDLNMPVLDGYGAAEKIRNGAAPGQEQVPIIAYTTESAYLSHVRTEKTGMNEFISKPFSKYAFLTTLTQVLNKATNQQLHLQAGDTLAGKCILIANDEPITRDILAHTLTSKGLEVVHASDGAEALDQLWKKPCDLILMDMNMPGMDGLEATMHIRKTPGTSQHIPIIMFTGNADDESKQIAAQAGANDFASTSIGQAQLLEKITALLLGQPGAEKKTSQEPTEEQVQVQLQPLPQTTEHGVPFLGEGILQELTDPATRLRLVSGFENKASAWLPELGKAARENNLVEIKRILHSFTGTCGIVGAQALHELLTQVYLSFKSGEMPRNENWLENIERVNADTVRVFRAFIGQD